MSFNPINSFRPGQNVTPDMLNEMSNEDIAKLFRQFNDKIASVENEKNEVIAQYARNKICRFAQGNTLEDLTNAEISELVRNKLPSCTYESVRVGTQHADFWKKGDIKCRVITIKRDTIHFSEPFKAFFSKLFKTDSAYNREYHQETIAAYLLDAEFTNEDAAKKDIDTIFWQCKTITIYVPEKLDQDAYVELTNGSKIISSSMDAGKWFRKIFTKK